MSSKSIRIILHYTVSKLTHFFETQCSYTFCYLGHTRNPDDDEDDDDEMPS